MVSSPELTNPQRADGCFPGYRIVNQAKRPLDDKIDLVTRLLEITKYRHVKQPTLKLIAGGGVVHKPCGWEDTGRYFASLLEHANWIYSKRAKAVSNSTVPHLATYAAVGLDNSYNHNIAKVARKVKEHGWGLVGTAIVGSGFIILGTESSHLIQDPVSLRCLLTFEGSDDLVDFIEDIRIIRKPFCGLAQMVHGGFKSVVMEMVGSYDFQNYIRPKLQYCSKVDVLGHSLGGASASLFAACASNPLHPGAFGYDEYQRFSWTPSRPKKMDYL